MKLNGVAGDVEPGGMPSTLPHRTTSMWVPWKCSLLTASISFQLPPSPAVGLQPGFTLPPQLWRLPITPSRVPVMLLNFAPPPVSQQASLLQAGLLMTKSRVNSKSVSVVLKRECPPAGATNDSLTPSSGEA